MILILIFIRFFHNMIDIMHLRIVAALDKNGTLTEAANALHLTQSALSHQIRYLEQKLDSKVWKREGRRLRLTQAGQLLLQTAQKVLPVLDNTEQTLRAYSEGKRGVIRIGVECFPCERWLNNMIAHYLQAMPNIEVDIINRFQFSGLEGLLNHHIDVLITPDKIAESQLCYEPLFDYELVLLVSAQHALAKQSVVQAKDLIDETLITVPIAEERLDVFKQFLWPANCTPLQHKQIASIDIMLQLINFNRGVCTLPDWLAQHYSETMALKTLRLGASGIQKTLFACVRKDDIEIPYLKQLVQLGQQLGANLDA